jgi:hypothetical protein
MADAVKIESALYFLLNQITHESRFAPFLGGGTTSQRLSLFCWKTDGKSGFHG